MSASRAGALRRSYLALLFSFRIVAARLNGSLDFFSLETHTAFSPLQFRGQRVWAWQVPASDGWGAGAVCKASSPRPPQSACYLQGRAVRPHPLCTAAVTWWPVA